MLEKYTNLKAIADEKLTHTGDIHERQHLIWESKIYSEVIKDLKRTIPTHNDTQRNSLSLHDRELFFKED